jgi:ring-1,2-phenylacetyl-CoA epoxidase subunit PaaE
MTTDAVATPTDTRRGFHPLTVAVVDRVAEDAVAVTLAVPPALRDVFAFRAGQHVTVRRYEDGDDVRRSYSVCSTPADLAGRGILRIGVRQLPGGVFSGYAAGALRPGDTLSVLPPVGHFTSDFGPGRRRHYAAIAAGSGVTPVL